MLACAACARAGVCMLVRELSCGYVCGEKESGIGIRRQKESRELLSPIQASFTSEPPCHCSTGKSPAAAPE